MGPVHRRLLDEYKERVEEEGELTEEELPEEVLDQVEQAHTLERRHFAVRQGSPRGQAGSCTAQTAQ